MNRRTKLLLCLVWVLVVLYPNPMLLVNTIERTMSPPVDAEAVRQLAESLPADPGKIRDLVLNKYVVYDYDWNLYGVPWYFPSTQEVLKDGRGDCESQAVFLSSLLKAKGIPHQLKMSFDHIWVDYEKKPADFMENDAVAFVRRDGDSFEIRVPEKFDFNHYLEVQLDSRWHPMPVERKLLLLFGVVMIGWGHWLVLVASSMAASSLGMRTRARRYLGGYRARIRASS